MSSMIVGADGLLYKNGVKVPLEFGDEEQVKVIRAYEKKMKSYNTGTIKTFISYETKGTLLFPCVCDKTIKFVTQANDEDDIKCFDNSYVDCSMCKRKYHIYTTKHKREIAGKIYFEDSEVFVRLKK